MKNRRRVLLFLMLAAFAVSAFAYTGRVYADEPRNGWFQDADGYRYYVEDQYLKNTVRNEKFDLNNHTFKVRYRFFFSYEYIDDYDAGMQYRFTDWSDATSFGKSNEVTVALPDEIPAPGTSDVYFRREKP